MKSLKKIFIIIIVLLVVFSGVVYIDYFLVKTKNTFPKIAIKEELNDETTVYKAILYKVWYCKNNKSILTYFAIFRLEVSSNVYTGTSPASFTP